MGLTLIQMALFPFDWYLFHYFGLSQYTIDLFPLLLTSKITLYSLCFLHIPTSYNIDLSVLSATSFLWKLASFLYNWHISSLCRLTSLQHFWPLSYTNDLSLFCSIDFTQLASFFVIIIFLSNKFKIYVLLFSSSVLQRLNLHFHSIYNPAQPLSHQIGLFLYPIDLSLSSDLNLFPCAVLLIYISHIQSAFHHPPA